MHPLRAPQIRAARALLGWSQEKFANSAGLSVATVHNIEKGISPRNATNAIIRRVFADEGLEFIEGEGVRRIRNEITVFEGFDSCDRFFDDMLETVTKKGGDILCTIPTQDMIMRSWGLANSDNLGQLERLSAIANVRCLLSDSFDPTLLQAIQFRMISKLHAGPRPSYVYGDKNAMVLLDGGDAFKFIVQKSASWSQVDRDHFSALWDGAVPLRAQDHTGEKR